MENRGSALEQTTWQRVVGRLRRLVFRQFETERTDESSTWRLRIRVERDELDGGWVSECVTLPGCVAQGETREEALKNLEDAIRDVLAVRIDQALATEVHSGDDDFAISL